ncbi:unnamed protein product [Ectocarpus sp. 12 AP-2014]
MLSPQRSRGGTLPEQLKRSEYPPREERSVCCLDNRVCGVALALPQAHEQPSSSTQPKEAAQSHTRRGGSVVISDRSTTDGIPLPVIPPSSRGSRRGTPLRQRGSRRGTPLRQRGSRRGTPLRQRGSRRGTPLRQRGGRRASGCSRAEFRNSPVERRRRVLVPAPRDPLVLLRPGSFFRSTSLTGHPERR